MLSVLTVAFPGPTSKLVLFCRGRLIREAIGFCACLARSVSSCAIAGAVIVAVATSQAAAIRTIFSLMSLMRDDLCHWLA